MCDALTFLALLLLVNVPGAKSTESFCASDRLDKTICRCNVTINDHLSTVLQSVPAKTKTLIITGTLSEVQSFSFELPNLTDVTDLLIEDLQLKYFLDHALSGLDNLVNLSAANNLLSALPTTLLHDTKKLKRLNLRRNKFVEIPNVLNGSCLEELVFSKNTLLTLNNDVINSLKCLKVLSLSENMINELNVQFPETLEVLHLSHNDINWDNSQLIAKGLKNLTLTDVNFAKSERLTALSGVIQLQSLDLSSNDLSSIPDSLRDLHALKTLKLSGNKFTELKGNSFTDLSDLNELLLDNCAIGKISETPFSNLTKLKFLDMSENLLLEINGTFLSSTVTELRLRRSQIAAIASGSLDHLPNLERLDLSFNLLKYANPGAFDNIRTAFIDMSDNPIFCDCNVRKIRDWIIKYNAKVSIVCDTPDALEKRNVTSLNDTELDCSGPVFDRCCKRDVQAYVNSNITIHFETKGKPEPEITYDVLNGDPLPKNSTHYSSFGHTVVIYNVTMENSGNFTCTAKNEFGQSSVLIKVTIIPGSPTSYKILLAEIIATVLMSVIVLFTFVWLFVFICSKNRYFVYRPWQEDELESSYGSIQIRR